MELVTTAHPDDPAREMALTEALLDATGRGERPEAVRVYRPGPTVAFGRSDRLRTGYEAARTAALAHGRTPVVRLGGGHAAAYDRDCVVVEVIRRRDDAAGGLEERFADLTALLIDALGGAGVTAEVGELPGEYCPGRFSLHLPNGPKVAGVAQRVTVRANLTTAVLVVAGGAGLRAAIVDVYAALGLPVDPRTAGALSDRFASISTAAMLDAVIDAARRRYGGLRD